MKWQMRSNSVKAWQKIFVLILIVIAFWLPRGLELDLFVTPDEPKWLMRSANFYEAFARGDFEHTYQKGHPGVTITWAGTLGFLWRYRSYIFQDPGQRDSPQALERYLERYEYKPIDLLEAGRIIVVIGITLIMVLAFLQSLKLIGIHSSIVGFLFISFDPFLIAHSRLLHPDGLMSALMLLSLLSFMSYLYQGKRWIDLGISAIAAGISWLTKSPSLFLLPFVGLLTLIETVRLWSIEHQISWQALGKLLYPLILWVFIASVVFVLLWPAMWTDPIGSIRGVLDQGNTYANEGHESALYFYGKIYQEGITSWYFYPLNYLWRTSPVILAGLAFATLAIFLRRRLSLPNDQLQAAIILILFALLYTAFMTLGAKKFDRYLLPVFAPLALVAGLGWMILLQNTLKWSQERLFKNANANQLTNYGLALLLALVVTFQAIQATRTYPYYLSYYNPLLGGSKKAEQAMMIGWGEGLDQAARYLNAKPNASNLRVRSWYADGPFSYLFNGTTVLKDFEEDPQSLRKADYYVLYIHQWQRRLPSEAFLDLFELQKPEYIIKIDDLEYARIYRAPKKQ